MAKKIPAIRAAIAKELVNQGIQQERIAELLAVSQGAISQYINKHRGRDLFVAGFQNEIKEICQHLVKDKAVLEKEICALCKKIEAI
jgi:hypothetical protein